jgi:hypothetical protein
MMNNLEHGEKKPVGRPWNPMWGWVAFAVFVAIVIGTTFAMVGFEEGRPPSDNAAAVTQPGDV